MEKDRVPGKFNNWLRSHSLYVSTISVTAKSFDLSVISMATNNRFALPGLGDTYICHTHPHPHLTHSHTKISLTHTHVVITMYLAQNTCTALISTYSVHHPHHNRGHLLENILPHVERVVPVVC